MSLNVWSAKAFRDLGAGGSMTTEAMCFGATEESAWRFFDRHFNNCREDEDGGGREPWKRHEVDLELIPQVGPTNSTRATGGAQ